MKYRKISLSCYIVFIITIFKIVKANCIFFTLHCLRRLPHIFTDIIFTYVLSHKERILGLRFLGHTVQ